MVCRPDSRQEQQLGRGDASGAEHDLFALGLEPFPAAVNLDPDRAIALEQDPAGRNIAFHCQVEPVACGPR